jgi:CHAD domain-containing protein
MATSESIYDYYLHQQSNSENYLEQCMVHAEPEVVHQLRLCIKKLRAFNILAKEIGLSRHEEHKRMTFRTKKMFKLAGQIRDIQVQILLLSAYEEKTGSTYPEFSKWLVKREKKRISRLCRIPRKDKNQETSGNEPNAAFSGIVDASDETVINSAVIVLDGLYSKVQKLATGYISDENLHRIRKIAKQLKYIQNIMFSCYPDFHFDPIHISTLREIDVAAGHWHDKLLRIELLGRYIETMQESNEQTTRHYHELMDVCFLELDVAYEEACSIVKSKLL